MTEFESLPDFARRRGVSRQAAHKWKMQGLLVLRADGKVDVAASEAALERRPAVYRGGKTNRSERKIDAAPTVDVDADNLAETAERLIATGQVVMLPHADAVRKKENYLALLRELEYDRESGKVAEIDDVAAAVAAVCAVIRNNLLGLPAKVAPRVAMLRTAEEVKDLLATEVTKILEDLSLDGGGTTAGAREAVRARFATA